MKRLSAPFLVGFLLAADVLVIPACNSKPVNIATAKPLQAQIELKNALRNQLMWFSTYMEETPKPLSTRDIVYLAEQLASEDDLVPWICNIHFVREQEQGGRRLDIRRRPR